MGKKKYGVYVERESGDRNMKVTAPSAACLGGMMCYFDVLSMAQGAVRPGRNKVLPGTSCTACCAVMDTDTEPNRKYRKSGIGMPYRNS